MTIELMTMSSSLPLSFVILAISIFIRTEQFRLRMKVAMEEMVIGFISIALLNVITKTKVD